MLKFKAGDRVRFVGGVENDYHNDYKAIMGKTGTVMLAVHFPDVKWPYDIAIDGMGVSEDDCYPCQEKELEPE